MKPLSKAVLLVLLLLVTGAPGLLRQACAESAGAPTHACCMGHEHVSTARCGMPATLSANGSCCEVAPAQPLPVQEDVLPGGSHDGAYGLQPDADGIFVMAAPTVRPDRGVLHLAKALSPPLHALLCTFLI